MLPSDPYIRLSYVNTKLRDDFPSLAEFCGALDADQNEIIAKMKSIGYVYDAGENQFKPE